MTINELCKEAYNNAKEAGWYDNEIEMGTRLMLVVSELAEAMEADRKNKHASLIHLFNAQGDQTVKFEEYVKDTFEDELADVVIRIADLCGKYEIDLETHISQKMDYNKTRGYKHGGKKY